MLTSLVILALGGLILLGSILFMGLVLSLYDHLGGTPDFFRNIAAGLFGLLILVAIVPAVIRKLTAR